MIRLIAIAVAFALSSCAAPGAKPDNPTGSDFEKRSRATRDELDSRLADHEAEVLYMIGKDGLTNEQAILKMIAALQMKIEKLYQMHGIKAGRGFDGKFETE
jgi:hypothetical protein